MFRENIGRTAKGTIRTITELILAEVSREALVIVRWAIRKGFLEEFRMNNFWSNF